jgi:SAM-dependent methyltransferase
MACTLRTITKKAQPSWSVLELGCGSGILAEKIYKLLRHYEGVDIALNAIELAKKKITSPNVHFIAHDVLNIPIKKYDLIIFIGLIDWLSEKNILLLFEKIDSPFILFSFTESGYVNKLNPYWYYRKHFDSSAGDGSIKARSFTLSFFDSVLVNKGYTYEVIQSPSILNPCCLIWAKKLTSY